MINSYDIETVDGRRFVIHNRTREELLDFLRVMNITRDKLVKVDKKDPQPEGYQNRYAHN